VHSFHFRSPADPSKIASAVEWKKLFETMLITSSLKPPPRSLLVLKLGARVAATNPSTFQSFWKDAALITSLMTSTWYGAYLLFGAPWSSGLCFDRIAHPTAIMALERLGLPQNAIHSSFRTLQLTKYNVRTAFGDYRQSYSPYPYRPIKELDKRVCEQRYALQKSCNNLKVLLPLS